MSIIVTNRQHESFALKYVFFLCGSDSDLVTMSLAMLRGSLSPRHGASSGCGWKRRPPDMDGKGKGKSKGKVVPVLN
jgi:hypothetical protein